jgi:hypothetical protein
MKPPRRAGVRTVRRMWAWIVRDGSKPELVPWGEGGYWQMPIFHTRKDARAWRVEHPDWSETTRLVRAKVSLFGKLPLGRRKGGG